MLTTEWIEERLTAGICERTGHDLAELGGGGPWVPSIDRVDPGRGYVPDNCQVVCWIYNRAKGTDTDADVLEMARCLIAEADC